MRQNAPDAKTHVIDVLLPEDQSDDGALGDTLRRAALAALQAAEAGPGALTVVLSEDDEVRALNRQFRGIDKPTNVLSFAEPQAPPAPGEPPFLGDVVLARETIAREAGEQATTFEAKTFEAKTFEAHAAHLVVHGVLHLLGYTHDTDKDAARMERLEVAALARLGLPDPYAETDFVETQHL